MAETAKKTTDWERIKAEFGAGILSVREIGAAHGVSHTAINKRAKAEGWTRDLSAKIKAKADALVSKAAVSKEVSSAAVATERETVDANAKAIADLRLSHRSTVKTGRNLVEKLLAECTGMSDNLGLFDQLRDALAEETEDPDQRKRRAAKLDEMLQRVLSLPGRVSAVKGLSEALRNLIGLEREAWGLTTAPLQAPLESLSDDDLKAELARLRAQAT
jgi:hypothetical protein